MKTHTIDFKEFMSGEYKRKQNKDKALYMAIVGATGVYFTFCLPKGVFAATSGETSFKTLYDSLMTLFDGGVVVMIVFCGVLWAFGNRGAAIERLIGAGAGYVLARNAMEIRDFFKSI